MLSHAEDSWKAIGRKLNSHNGFKLQSRSHTATPKGSHPYYPPSKNRSASILTTLH